MGIFDAFYEVLNWFYSGIYEFATEAMAQFIEWSVVGAIKTKIFFALFFWDVAENILANLGLSALINQAWANLDSRLLAYLTFFRLPEAINILLQAVVTRFSLRMFGL